MSVKLQQSLDWGLLWVTAGVKKKKRKKKKGRKSERGYEEKNHKAGRQ